jgi:hypothetical protein
VTSPNRPPADHPHEPSEVAAIRRLTRYLNQPMVNRLRRCADHDTGDGSWGEATIYTPEAIQLVALVDAVDALLGSDGTDRDARVRAQALRDFAEAMRVLAEDAPADEPAKWPWSGYALAAVKAEEYAGKGFPSSQGSTEGDSGELLLHHRYEQGQPITCGARRGYVTAVVEDVRCSGCLAALAEEGTNVS